MKHAVITAGSKGIGKMVTEQFLEKGCSVTVNYRSDELRIETLKKEWKPYMDQIQFVQGDITKKEDIVHIVNQAMEKFGRIDYLINNAGPYVFERKKLVDYQDAEQAPGWIYRSAFSAAKVGLVSLTKSIAIEEAENGITANMVSPGDIVGDMKEKPIQEARKMNDENTPIGRPGTGEDIAR